MGAAEERRFLELAAAGRRFMLTSHAHPDADGVGSEIALARFLQTRGVRTRTINPDATPETLAFLDPGGEVEAYDPRAHDAAILEADVIVVLDNSDPQRLEALEGPVRNSPAVRVCIDHHPDPDPLWDVLLVRLNASCTGTLVFDLIKAAGGSIDEPTATALYAALASDTGRFRFGNATAEGHRVAAELVLAGAHPPAVYAQFSERLSAGFLRLAGEILAGMEVRCSGRLVVLRAQRAQVDLHGVPGEDLAEVINQALRLRTGRIAALFRELEPGLTKVSLRSKGELDVNELARRHGGGGHRNASGIVMRAGLEDSVARLLPDLEGLADRA